MKERFKTVLKILFFVSIFAMLGVAGNIENGAPIDNAVWCLPFLLIMAACVAIYRINDWDLEE